MKQSKLNRINFESSTNIPKCLLLLLLLLVETNLKINAITTHQYNKKHLQNNDVHGKATSLLQYTHP